MLILRRWIALALFRIGCFIEQADTPRYRLPFVKERQREEYELLKRAFGNERRK